MNSASVKHALNDFFKFALVQCPLHKGSSFHRWVRRDEGPPRLRLISSAVTDKFFLFEIPDGLKVPKLKEISFKRQIKDVAVSAAVTDVQMQFGHEHVHHLPFLVACALAGLNAAWAALLAAQL